MKELKLSNSDISALCLGLAQLFRAGIAPGDALSLMAEDETAPRHRAMLSAMAEKADEGAGISEVFRHSGCLPAYVCSLAEIGERSGRTEEALFALASYYENRARLSRQMRDSLLYPAAMAAVMLLVVVALLVWVLPVFDEVYARLGGGLEGAAAGLLRLGRLIGAALPYAGAIAAAAAIAAALIAFSPALRNGAAAFFNRTWGGRGVFLRVNLARFAQGLSMGLSSGLDVEEALRLSRSLAAGVPAVENRCGRCLESLAAGESLARALGGAELLPRGECRVLEAGLRSGSGDAVMEKIAARMLEESEAALERRMGRIEPALVLAASLAVGLILVLVMLPLMNIMSAIG